MLPFLYSTTTSLWIYPSWGCEQKKPNGKDRTGLTKFKQVYITLYLFASTLDDLER